MPMLTRSSACSEKSGMVLPFRVDVFGAASRRCHQGKGVAGTPAASTLLNYFFDFGS